jgi:hypothetical protein
MTKPNFREEPLDFSLVLGGPVFQLFRRLHLAGDDLELLQRRLLTITLVAWLPLLLLSAARASAGVLLGFPSFKTLKYMSGFSLRFRSSSLRNSLSISEYVPLYAGLSSDVSFSPKIYSLLRCD